MVNYILITTNNQTKNNHQLCDYYVIFILTQMIKDAFYRSLINLFINERFRYKLNIHFKTKL